MALKRQHSPGDIPSLPTKRVAAATCPHPASLSSSESQPRYDPPKGLTKAEQSEWRRNERKLRNRASAAASRQKQRDRIAELELVVADLRKRLSKYESVNWSEPSTATPPPTVLSRTASTTTMSAPKQSVTMSSKMTEPSLSLQPLSQSRSNRTQSVPIITPLPLSSTEPAEMVISGSRCDDKDAAEANKRFKRDNNCDSDKNCESDIAFENDKHIVENGNQSDTSHLCCTSFKEDDVAVDPLFAFIKAEEEAMTEKQKIDMNESYPLPTEPSAVVSSSRGNMDQDLVSFLASSGLF